MGLIITNAKVKNTEITIPSVYARLQWTAAANGINVTVQLFTGLTKQDVLNGFYVHTNLPATQFIEMETGQHQDIQNIHNGLKTKLEELGFTVTIDLV